MSDHDRAVTGEALAAFLDAVERWQDAREELRRADHQVEEWDARPPTWLKQARAARSTDEEDAREALAATFDAALTEWARGKGLLE